jgi:hypothetical protein
MAPQRATDIRRVIADTHHRDLVGTVLADLTRLAGRADETGLND